MNSAISLLPIWSQMAVMHACAATCTSERVSHMQSVTYGIMSGSASLVCTAARVEKDASSCSAAILPCHSLAELGPVMAT